MAEQYAGPYAAMKFPEYVFREYPKMVKNKAGQSIVVNNQREELALASEPSPDLPPDPVVDERNALLTRVAELEAALQASKTPATPPEPVPIAPAIPPEIGSGAAENASRAEQSPILKRLAGAGA